MGIVNALVGLVARLLGGVRGGHRCELGRSHDAAGAGRQLDDLTEGVGEPQRRVDLRRREPRHEELADQNRRQRGQQEPATPRHGIRGGTLRVFGHMHPPTTREPEQQEDRRGQRDDGHGGESGDEARGDDAHVGERGQRGH